MPNEATEPLHVKITGDESNLDQALTHALKSTINFVNNMTAGTRKIATATSNMNNSMSGGLNKVINWTQSLDRAVNGATGSVQRLGNSSVRVAALERSFNMGIVTHERYRRSLQNIADTAEVGSRKQVEALAAIQRAEEKAATASKKRHDQEERHANGGGASSIAQGIAAGIATGVTNMALNAGGQAFNYLNEATDKAADLGEAVNKSQVIFRNSSSDIEGWAKGAVDALGQTEKQAIDAAASFGGLLRAAGYADSTNAELSKSLVARATDISSLYNGKISDVLRDMQSGLNGQVEPMRKFGVFLSESAVSAEAFSLGLGKVPPNMDKVRQAQTGVEIATVKAREALKTYGADSTQAASANLRLEKANATLEKALGNVNGKLTDQDKIQARVSLLMKQSAVAAGDYAKTADSASNKQKKLNAEMDAFQTKIGQDLLPMKHDLLGFFSDMMGVVNDARDAIKLLVDEISSADANEFGLGPGIKRAIESLKAISETLHLNIAQAKTDASAQSRAMDYRQFSQARNDLNAGTMTPEQAEETERLLKSRGALPERDRRKMPIEPGTGPLSAAADPGLVLPFAREANKQEALAIIDAALAGAKKDMDAYMAQSKAAGEKAQMDATDYTAYYRQSRESTANGTPDPKPHPHPTHTGGRGGSKGGASVPVLPVPSVENPFELLGNESMAEINAMPTNAATYRKKGEIIDSRYASAKLSATQAGTFDEFAHEKSLLEQKIKLAGDAIANTAEMISTLTGLLQFAEATKEERYASLVAKHTALQSAMKADPNSENTKNLKVGYQSAYKSYNLAKGEVDTLRGQIKDNAGVNSDATKDAASGMNAKAALLVKRLTDERKKFLDDLEQGLNHGTYTRGQYEQQLMDAMLRVGTGSPDHKMFSDAYENSAGNRKQTFRGLHKETLTLTKKDFDAQREAVTEREEELKGTAATEEEKNAITAWAVAKRKQITRDEFDYERNMQEDAHREQVRMGAESLATYRAFLVDKLAAVKAEYGSESTEALKAQSAIFDIDADIMSRRIAEFRANMDDGKKTLMQYRQHLVDLRSTLPPLSQEFRAMSEEIRNIDRAQKAASKQRGDAIGDVAGDAAVAIFRKRSTLSQVMRDIVAQSVDSGIKQAVKGSVSKAYSSLFGYKEPADAMKEAAKGNQDAATTFTNGVIAFAQNVNTFVAALTSASNGQGAGGQSSASGTGVGNVANGISSVADALGGKGGKDNALSSILSSANTVSGVIKNLDKNAAKVFGKASSTTKSIQGAGKFAAEAGKWLGYAGAAFSVWETVKSFTALKEGGFQTKQGNARFAFLNGDHTGLFDSGKSGADGLRFLEQRDRNAQARGRVVQHITNHNNPTIVIQGAGKSAAEIAHEVSSILTQQNAINASYG